MAENYFMVVKERMPSTVDQVSLATITDGFQEALRRSGGVLSRWVGPAPRVTRTGGLLAPEVVRVAWLLSVPTPASGLSPQNLANNLATGIDGIIEPGKWNDAVVTPYQAAVNGSIDWWQTGAASRTLTMNQTLPLSTERPENPVGPDDAGTRPGGAPGSQPASQLTEWLTLAAVIVIPISIAVVASNVMPAITLWGASRSTRQMARNETRGTAPRENPRRQGRRSRA